MTTANVLNRAVSVLAALGLAAVCVACGGDDAAEPPFGSATSLSQTTPTSSTDLDALLLDAADLGEGWTVTETGVEDLGSLAESPCQDTAINPTIVARLRPTAGVTFEPTDGSLRGVQQLVLSGHADRLARDLDALFGAIEQCMGAQTTTPDAEKVERERFEIPELGDQRSATRLAAFEPPDYQTTWRGRSAFVRVGSVVMLLNQFDILPSPEAEPLMTDTDFVELLERAVAKLSN